MDEKARYSAKERRAYYMGVGAAIGNARVIGVVVRSLPKAEKESFYNGMDDTMRKKLAGIKKNKKGR